jgi:hypothetical protein
MVTIQKHGLLALFLAGISAGCTYNEGDLRAGQRDSGVSDVAIGTDDLPTMSIEVDAGVDDVAVDAPAALDTANLDGTGSGIDGGDRRGLDGGSDDGGNGRVDGSIDGGIDGVSARLDGTARPDGSDDRSITVSPPDGSDLRTSGDAAADGIIRVGAQLGKSDGGGGGV